MGETKPNETKPSDKILFEPKREKVVGRNVAITFGIICILLGAILATVLFMSYSPTLDSSIPRLQSQLTNTQNQLTNVQGQLASLQDQNDALQAQVNDLTSVLNMTKSETWAISQTVSQPAGTYNFWAHSATYAGYVTVNVESSTTDKTYIEVLWNSNGISYYNKTSVGAGGSGIFPVLPSSVEVRVGNADLINGATETVTIVYHY
jgi:cell division protein FtsL